MSGHLLKLVCMSGSHNFSALDGFLAFTSQSAPPAERLVAVWHVYHPIIKYCNQKS